MMLDSLTYAALAIVVISLAVANRQPVSISLDPFDPARPALTVSHAPDNLTV